MLQIELVYILAFAFIHILNMNFQYQSNLRYSNIHLRIVSFRSPESQILPDNILERLNFLGINANLIKVKNRKTRRGKRGKGGRGRYRSRHERRMNDQRGVNVNNLIQIGLIKDDMSCLNFGVLNARSVCNKSGVISTMISQEDLDICVLTETWLRDDSDVIRAECTPVSYVMKDLVRDNFRRGGGTAVICREYYRLHLLNSGFKVSYEFSEWSLKVQNADLLILVIYRSPGSSAALFISDFSVHLQEIINSPKKLIIAGDFNFHVNDINDVNSVNLIDLLSSFGLVNHVTFPTHTQLNTLDLFITKRDTDFQILSCFPSDFISDHCLVKIKLSLTTEKHQVKTIYFRNFNSVDIVKLKHDLKNSNLASIDSNMNLDQMADVFDSAISSIIDEHAPLITKNIIVKTLAPWYNSELRYLKKSKRHFERRWRNTGSIVDLNIFKLARTVYMDYCNDAKKTYYTEKILDCQNDQAKLYKLIAKLSSNSSAVIYPEHATQNSLANDFASYFLGKVERIRSGLESIQPAQPSDNFYHSESAISKPNFLSFNRVSRLDVDKLISQSSNSSSSLDPIPSRILKQCRDVFLGPISTIINKSLESGLFPKRWKCASVTPLLKKSNLEPELSNYRPISNLSYISKLIEKSVLSQMTPHLNNFETFYKNNSAYKQYHSTETQLLKIYNDLTINMSNQQVTLLVLLDMSAAFDTVDHNTLVEVLQNTFNISGSPLNWFRSYLSDRTLQVKINRSLSDVFNVPHGVPQGSCVGPIAFLAYIASLYDIISQYLVSVGGYADDNQIYLAFNPSDDSSIAQAIEKIETCISAVKLFLTERFLKFNDDKTDFIIIGTPQQLSKLSNINLKIGSATIYSSSSVNNLGVIFDQNLNMKSHINSISKSAYYQLSRIRQLRRYLDTKVAESLVHAFITSKLDYCNSLFYNLPQNLVNKLQLIQNSAARIISYTPRFSHITPVLKSLHWLPVRYRITYKIALLTFKCLHNLAPDYLIDLVQPYAPTRTLRSSNASRLKEPRVDRELGRRSFYYAAPTVWNALPPRLRHEENLLSFKAGLKKHLFSLAF